MTIETTLLKVCEIYTQRGVAERLNLSREEINRWVTGKLKIPEERYSAINGLLPPKPSHWDSPEFRYIDLFAGIGGLRKPFEDIGGKCVFTCEWNDYARRTYEANFYHDPDSRIQGDIRECTTDESAIQDRIPDHDLLLAGFPCQPFSIAGVSKKNSLGRVHGFACETQGTLFFEVAKIIKEKRPKAFVLENVKNLKSHDKGNTFRVIMKTLREELGYIVPEPQIIDASHWVPQHRERIVIAGFAKECGFKWPEKWNGPERKPLMGDILQPESEVDDKYILSNKLWEYLKGYKAKHLAKGNGFGFGLVGPESVSRTLSARYYKDGSEVLVGRKSGNPRRLTPTECARLMGFDGPGESSFRIPVSDTQAYKQFGNSVVVPKFAAVANCLKGPLLELVKQEKEPTPQMRLVG